MTSKRKKIMTTKRVLGVVSVLVAIALIELVIVLVSPKSENCWDQYKTENAAIEACETHGPIIGD
jgi:hypothetical protein